MPRPVALIIGITGQDGSFLAELLLGKGYAVHGLRRRTSLPNLGNLAGLMAPGADLHLHHGDLMEGGSLLRVLQRVRPDEVYNFAGLTMAPGCAPQKAAGLHALGTQRLLDALRLHDPARAVRLFQASSYEIFGSGAGGLADEQGPFAPASTTGVARLQAFWLIAEARDRTGMHASSGIAFPHASARAAPHALLRHVLRGAVTLAAGAASPLALGGLDVPQHWGHARDHAEAAWRILQQAQPADFVLASGPVLPLRAVVARAFALAGITLRWQGSGADEQGLCAATGRVLVRLDPTAPACRAPLGDASRARRELGWQPEPQLDALLYELLADERAALACRTA